MVTGALGAGHGRRLRTYQARVAKIGAREEATAALSDAELTAAMGALSARAQDGVSLDDLLVECFALVREAGVRRLGMRLYDEQLIGAQALHSGAIAEMKTGEGKTFAAVAAVALHALAGAGVHVVTVNEYLAGRDAEWMSPVYELLGLSVGVIRHDLDPIARRAAYACDVTYGTNSEFGFDYLRDNMAYRTEDRVQRGHVFCVVDEVDSILIDEARTPLIISGSPQMAADTYYRLARIVPTLRRGTDYEVDEKQRTAFPLEPGVEKVERALGVENLYLDVHSNLVNHLIQALRAEALFTLDKEYLVRDGEVFIIDEFTGRVLEGRRYSEGLHQALEAKEGLRIQEENQTLATITLQNYFRLYETLSGMTGTAATEATEFGRIYGVDVVEVPTHRPVARTDEPDLVYANEQARFRAVCDEIEAAHERGQPVLVGTISVEVSERLSKTLSLRGITHHVLNAKQHEREAEIIAHAGTRGAVTIATNMAGRGVDIKLGEGVDALGGLYVIGTSRHESRRIDNQLRGRSGRQGDPGRSRFYLSADDDLIRIFAGERIQGLLERFGGGDDAPLESKLFTRSIERAQKRVEERNFQIRKRVLEYDDVLNRQRMTFYAERRRALEAEDLSEHLRDWIVEQLVHTVDEHAEDGMVVDWDADSLYAALVGLYPTSLTREQLANPKLDRDRLLDMLEDDALERYDAHLASLDDDAAQRRLIERMLVVQLFDAGWREHLSAMDYLREGIHLRGLSERDPLAEYRLEGAALFEEMMDRVRRDIVRYVYRLEVVAEPEPEEDLTYTAPADPVSGEVSTTSGGGTGSRADRRAATRPRGAVAASARSRNKAKAKASRAARRKNRS